MSNDELKEIGRSFALTFLAVFLPLLMVPEFEWGWPAIWAAAVAALRTAVSAALPGGSFGRQPRTGE